MRNQGRRRLTIAVVSALLTLSSADLFGDLIGLPVCASDAGVEVHEALPPAGTPLSREDTSDTERHHVDDCFCCSHCVQHGDVVELVPSQTGASVPDPSPPAEPALLPAELFHPPQAS